MNKGLIFISLGVFVLIGIGLFLTSDKTVDDSNNDPTVCAIEQCHGLDVTCGSDVAEFCTLEYKLGDFCRTFVDCEISNNSCVKVVDPRFEGCRSCVEKCDSLTGEEAFDCESTCVSEFEGN